MEALSGTGRKVYVGGSGVVCRSRGYVVDYKLKTDPFPLEQTVLAYP